MKRILILLVAVCFVLFNYTSLNSKSYNDGQTLIKISKDTFLKGMAVREICTNTADIGDEVTFINMSDMYVGETNVIPEKSLIYGYIEDIREPIQGSNSAIRIKFTKIMTPDKIIIPIQAYLFSRNGNYVGGEQTNVKYYVTMPHFTKGLGKGIADGTLQYAPTNIREDGKHTIIKPGSEMFIIFQEDLKIY